LIKNSQPFGKKFQKTVGGGDFFLTHTVVLSQLVAVKYACCCWIPCSYPHKSAIVCSFIRLELASALVILLFWAVGRLFQTPHRVYLYYYTYCSFTYLL